jgi:hypothetical protein
MGEIFQCGLGPLCKLEGDGLTTTTENNHNNNSNAAKKPSLKFWGLGRAVNEPIMWSLEQHQKDGLQWSVWMDRCWRPAGGSARKAMYFRLCGQWTARKTAQWVSNYSAEGFCMEMGHHLLWEAYLLYLQCYWCCAVLKTSTRNIFFTRPCVHSIAHYY